MFIKYDVTVICQSENAINDDNFYWTCLYGVELVSKYHYLVVSIQVAPDPVNAGVGGIITIKLHW